MDEFNHLIINFIDDNKWINKFDNYFAHHPELIITINHMDLIINKKIKSNSLNKILLKFINFGYIPSNEQIITILHKMQLHDDIDYFIRILLKTKKNKKIIKLKKNFLFKFSYVANTGDSRSIMSKNWGGKIDQLTQDHKPNQKSEEIRIINAGGKVYQY